MEQSEFFRVLIALWFLSYAFFSKFVFAICFHEVLWFLLDCNFWSCNVFVHYSLTTAKKIENKEKFDVTKIFDKITTNGATALYRVCFDHSNIKLCKYLFISIKSFFFCFLVDLVSVTTTGLFRNISNSIVGNSKYSVTFFPQKVFLIKWIMSGNFH